MYGEKIVYERAILSFKSFVFYMFIAGLSIAIISSIFQFLLSLYKLVMGDSSIAFFALFKPFISIVSDPIDAIISGVIIYPIYKILMTKINRVGIRLSVQR